MVSAPTTRYAQERRRPHRVSGGRRRSDDLVFVPGWVSHLEYAWEDPSVLAFLSGSPRSPVSSSSTGAGTGLSDRVAELPTLEKRMDDVRAVMDAAGSERAALFGLSEGGPMCLLFAATYPERTSALVLYGTFARLLRRRTIPSARRRTRPESSSSASRPRGARARSARALRAQPCQRRALPASWARFERLAASPRGCAPCPHGRRDRRPGVLPASASRRWSSIAQGDLMHRVERARTWPSAFRARSTSSCPGATISRGSATPRPLDEVEEFLTGVRHGADPTACSPP